MESHGIQLFLGLFGDEESAKQAYKTKLKELNEVGSLFPLGIGSALHINETESSIEMTSAESGRLIWERLCCIYQRLLLASSTRAKLAELQVSNPNYHKDAILKALNEEIAILGVAKKQLEDALCRAFAKDLSSPNPQLNRSEKER